MICPCHKLELEECPMIKFSEFLRTSVTIPYVKVKPSNKWQNRFNFEFDGYLPTINPDEFVHLIDAYELFQIKFSATEDEIKYRYYYLLKQYHPDFNIGQDDMAKKITNYYKIILRYKKNNESMLKLLTLSQGKVLNEKLLLKWRDEWHEDLRNEIYSKCDKDWDEYENFIDEKNIIL
jgi:hypothetical protein